MTHDETQAGTPVLEMSADEYRDFLDKETNERLGMSAEAFRRRYVAGELDDSDPDVGMLAVLIASRSERRPGGREQVATLGLLDSSGLGELWIKSCLCSPWPRRAPPDARQSRGRPSGREHRRDPARRDHRPGR